MDVFDLADSEAAHARGRPLPEPDNVSAYFWAEAAAGSLAIQRCTGCNRAQFYPRAICVYCGADTDWEEASGDGVVATYTVIRQNLAPPFDALGPYVVAIIELAEGPKMMSNVTHIDPSQVRVGLAVTCYAIRVRDDLGLPFWRPA